MERHGFIGFPSKENPRECGAYTPHFALSEFEQQTNRIYACAPASVCLGSKSGRLARFHENDRLPPRRQRRRRANSLTLRDRSAVQYAG